MLFARDRYLVRARFKQHVMGHLIEQIGIDGLAVEESDPMLERFALGAHDREIAFGHVQLVLSLMPCQKAAFAEEEAVAKITAHCAADGRKQDELDVSP